MAAPQAETPHYVLMNRSERIGPQLLADDSGVERIAIFGFSDKQPYDAFCKKCDLALTPYPLVKGYLQSRLEDAGDATVMIVIDAAGPDEKTLTAATMQSVLEAHEKQAAQVSVTYHLTKDDQSAAYHVEE